MRWSLLLLSLLISAQAFAAGEVNLYSARKEALIKPLLDRFTEETGIDVNLITGKADALVKRMQSEGINSPADLLLTVDAGRLHRAEAAGLLRPAGSERLDQIVPAAYRDPRGLWYGLSLRARTIVYAKDRVDPKELSTYEDLADPKWRGRICIRSSNNIYNQSLVAALIDELGEPAAEAWAKGLVANLARPPKGGDRDQIKAVSVGQCDIAVINTYYLGTMLASKDERERRAAATVAVFWPNQQDRGVHMNISGAGIAKYAKHPDNARRLLEFFVGHEAQAWYGNVNFEYPVVAGVEESDTLKSWGAFKPDTINLSRLGDNNAAAVKLMDRAGWR